MSHQLSLGRHWRVFSAVAPTSLMLAGCETATTFHSATGEGFAREAFSDQRIEANRFQVSFAGNGFMSRDTVERYLLYRAAQLTVQNGLPPFRGR